MVRIRCSGDAISLPFFRYVIWSPRLCFSFLVCKMRDNNVNKYLSAYNASVKKTSTSAVIKQHSHRFNAPSLFDIFQTSPLSSNGNFSSASSHRARAELCSMWAVNALPLPWPEAFVLPGDALSAGTAPSLQ